MIRGLSSNWQVSTYISSPGQEISRPCMYSAGLYLVTYLLTVPEVPYGGGDALLAEHYYLSTTYMTILLT